jgi:hypothetical protein
MRILAFSAGLRRGSHGTSLVATPPMVGVLAARAGAAEVAAP